MDVMQRKEKTKTLDGAFKGPKRAPRFVLPWLAKQNSHCARRRHHGQQSRCQDGAFDAGYSLSRRRF